MIRLFNLYTAWAKHKALQPHLWPDSVTEVFAEGSPFLIDSCKKAGQVPGEQTYLL